MNNPSLWSFRSEFKYVLLAFLIVLCLPLIAVLILTQVGLNSVSNKLVTVDTATHTIQLRNPKDGSIVKEIQVEVAWPTQGTITLEFGQSSFYQPFHTGIDIAGKKGDTITPAMAGTVIYAGETFWGFGKHVIIDNGNNIQTIYAHLNTINVSVGQKVSLETVIGTEGQTGWATGPHLHFQINVYGIPVNPRLFVSY
jgi:murein DD-endopeptidase MepM/ murein hydrolase activator NlpD